MASMHRNLVNKACLAGAEVDVRLLYLLVDETAPTSERITRRLRYGQAVVPAGWTFGVEAIRLGPPRYEESAVGHALAVPGIVHAILSQQHLYDAVLIGCFGDPGLRAARAVAEIPIVGPAEASFFLARLAGRQFGVVTVARRSLADLEAYIATLELKGECVGIEAVPLEIRSILDDDKRTLDSIRSAAQILVQRGADVIVLGCMTFGFHPFASELQSILDVSVIDPLRASIAALQATSTLRVRLGGNTPKCEYPDEVLWFLSRLKEAG